MRALLPRLSRRLVSGSWNEISPTALFSRAFYPQPPPASRSVPRPVWQRPFLPHGSRRCRSDLATFERYSKSNSVTSENVPARRPRPDQPSYDITFTCKPCKDRSTHRITKQGYHRGSILIQCPSCKNRHVISDHLRIFTEAGGTLEEIVARHGGLIKKGKLGIRPGSLVGNEGEEDIEFWEDDTNSPYLKRKPLKESPKP